MFALIANGEGIDEDSVTLMAQALRGGTGNLRFRFDEPGSHLRRLGAAVRSPGLLPEDQYDTQPLTSPTGDVIFVCQARLDNREELLTALSSGLGPSAEISDASLLFTAYQKWGESCVDHLTGDYVFAAYTKSSRSLIAAVDHLGHFRLYYAVSHRRILLSTQLAALRACPDLSLTCNESALGLCAEARFEPGETPYNEIRSLPGGYLLRWTIGDIKTRRWWQPATSARSHFSKPSDYVERTRELFGRAVKSCLRSSTPVSSTLSGGLDSSLVTATAARYLGESGQQLTCYTASPDLMNPLFKRPGWDADDTPYAAQTVAFHSNLRHRVVRSDGRIGLDLCPQIHQLSGGPVRNGSNYLWIDTIARTAASSGSRVLLTGAGGNFSISYTGLGAFAELFWSLQWSAAFEFARASKQAGEKSLWKTILGGLLPPRLFGLVHSQLYGERTARPQRLSFTTKAFRERHVKLLHPQRPPPRTRNAFIRKAISGEVIWTVDPLPQWGIDMRDPTTDRHLLEFLLTVPLAAFVQQGKSRGLARELGKGLLPEAVRLRRTQGQQSADYAAAMQRKIGQYRAVERIMNGSAACRGIFDMQSIRSGIDLVGRGDASLVLCDNLDRAVGAAIFLLENERHT